MLLLSGGLLLLVGAAMIAGGVVSADTEAGAGAGIGLIGGGAACALAGLMMAYLDWPSRREKGEGGRAKARILGAERQPGGVAGFPIVKLDLEVRPKGRPAYRVTRKFTADKFSKFEVGQEIAVRITDPANPEKIDLA